jgi:undecaprenyl-diphosphatase
MSIIQAVILGLVQGATEFIPVSSSGHLVLVPWLLGWPPPGLVFDTIVHWGTLLALLAYFWRDWWALITAWLRGLIHWDWHEPQARLVWLLVVGSIPAVVLGYLFKDWLESLFSQPAWVSFFLLVTAGLLVLGERLGRFARQIDSLGWLDALLIGLGQAAAIAPGISRSGATISVGLVRGMERPAAARFSFLLGTPAILGAGLLQLGTLASTPDPLAQLPVLAAGLLAAFIGGYVCIWGLLRYLQRGRLYPFAIYCALLGMVCLIITLLRG